VAYEIRDRCNEHDVLVSVMKNKTTTMQECLYKAGLHETICFSLTCKAYWWFIENEVLIMACYGYLYDGDEDWTMIDSFRAEGFLK